MVEVIQQPGEKIRAGFLKYGEGQECEGIGESEFSTNADKRYKMMEGPKQNRLEVTVRR